MALPEACLELLGHLKDEGERKALESIFEKHEPIRGAVLRQADYSRLANESAERVKKAETLAKKWDDWAKESVPKHEDLLKKFEAQVAANKDLEAKLQTAIAATGADVKLEDVQKHIEQTYGNRFLSKEEVAKIVVEEAHKIAENEKKVLLEQTIPQSMEYVATLNDLALEHRETFGEKFDRKAFSKFLVDGGYQDAQKAYQDYTADKRREVETKKIREEVRQELLKEQSGNDLPGSGVAPGESMMGPVRIQLSGKNPTPEGMTPAMAAAAELRQEKAGTL